MPELRSHPKTMAAKLLTIVVPTYNRADRLRLLLEALHDELRGFEHLATVLVSDNASNDHTDQVTADMTARWPDLQVQRHPQNVGAEMNFCTCVDRVTSRHLWIVGDDDCPKRGVIGKILSVLQDKRPALLYMGSEWLNPITGPDQGEPVGPLRLEWHNAVRYARRVHVWLTFISGVVIDMERLRIILGDQSTTRFNGTQLVQLGWILPLLRTDGPFGFIHDRCILATKDNSGGYGVLTVFGLNFTRIANESFGVNHPLSKALIHGNITEYLPGRIWGTRDGRDTEAYLHENPWTALDDQLGSRWLYWLLLVPLGRFPRWLAQPVFQTWRVLNRLRREWQQRFGVTSA